MQIRESLHPGVREANMKARNLQNIHEPEPHTLNLVLLDSCVSTTRAKQYAMRHLKTSPRVQFRNMHAHPYPPQNPKSRSSADHHKVHLPSANQISLPCPCLPLARWSGNALTLTSAQGSHCRHRPCFIGNVMRCDAHVYGLKQSQH